MKPSLTCSILINKLYKPKTHLLFLTLPHTNSTCIFIYVCPYHYDLYNRLFHAYPIKPSPFKPSLFLSLKTQLFKKPKPQLPNYTTKNQTHVYNNPILPSPNTRLPTQLNGFINGCLRIVFIRQFYTKSTAGLDLIGAPVNGNVILKHTL